MKAIILAAGYGKRLGKLTEKLPKPLIPLVNKPILKHLLETLNLAGLNDIIVVVGHLKNQMITFLSNCDDKGTNITIKIAESFRKGPIYSFIACADEIKDEDFILLPSDLIIEPSLLSDFLQYSKEREILVAFDDKLAYTNQSNVYVSSDRPIHQVLGITSKVNGRQYETKRLLPLLICRVNLCPFVEKSIELGYTKVIEVIEYYLHQKNEVPAFSAQDRNWFDLDTIRDIISTNNYLLNKLNTEGQSSAILNRFKSENITVKRPVLIGNNCQFGDNCLIGPNVSIGDQTLLGNNVKIRNSIIFPSSIIPNNSEFSNAIFFKEIHTIIE